VVPRLGGEADKFGNRYEGTWTIRHALHVLLGSGTSLCVEPGGPLGDGIEFVYRHDHGTEVHQVKRQNRNANSWNVASLRDEGVWESLRSHVQAGRVFHFVSILPARALDELADCARRSDLSRLIQRRGTDGRIRGSSRDDQRARGRTAHRHDRVRRADGDPGR